MGEVRGYADNTEVGFSNNFIVKIVQFAHTSEILFVELIEEKGTKTIFFLILDQLQSPWLETWFEEGKQRSNC